MKLNNISGVKAAPLLKSNWKRLYNGAKSFIGKILPKQHASQSQELQPDRLKDLLARVESQISHGGNGLLPESAQKDYQAYIRLLVAEGYNDGVVRSHSIRIASFVQAIAEDLYAKSLGLLTGRKQALQIELQSKQNVVRDKLIQVNLHQDYQNYLQYHNKFNERGNTIGEFVLYLICSLLIFIADIPLAADTLKWLMYPTKMGNQPFSITKLNENNLNPLITAIGIGLSTIFIKVWYDKFVGKKYGHAVISKKKFEELFDPARGDGGTVARQSVEYIDPKQKPASTAPEEHKLSTDEIKAIARNEKIIRAIEFILLGLTIAAVIMLGIFRGYVRSHGGSSEQDLPLAVTSLTLILITLLFSVVSGVCLSIALSALTNYRRMKKSKHEEQTLEKAYLASADEQAILEGKVQEAFQLSQELSSRTNWIKIIAQLLQSHYDIGYQEGYAVPGHYMQEFDFFDRVLFWRDQLTARIINASIHPQNPSDEKK